jgi:hypothetical protein
MRVLPGEADAVDIAIFPALDPVLNEIPSLKE